MELKRESIKLRGETFEIRELTIRQLAPIFENVDDDGKVNVDVIEIMKQAVHKDGKPMGEAVLDLPGSLNTKLLQAVMRVNDLGATEEGNA